MTRFLVVARADGRGGIKPFGASGWKKGTRVRIGKRNYKVTSDGRVNIPASAMNIGRLHKGRRVVEVKFSHKPGRGKGKGMAMLVSRPRLMSGKPRTGKKARKLSPKMVYMEDVELQPKDFTEYNWSPE